MTTLITSKKELKTAIKESVREVLDQEFMKMRAVLLPFVSGKEQKDIERLYGKPSRKVTKSRKLVGNASALFAQLRQTDPARGSETKQIDHPEVH